MKYYNHPAWPLRDPRKTFLIALPRKIRSPIHPNETIADWSHLLFLDKTCTQFTLNFGDAGKFDSVVGASSEAISLSRAIDEYRINASIIYAHEGRFVPDIYVIGREAYENDIHNRIVYLIITRQDLVDANGIRDSRKDIIEYTPIYKEYAKSLQQRDSLNMQANDPYEAAGKDALARILEHAETLKW